MREESLHEDIKYCVTHQLSDLPEFTGSSSQSWARAHFMSSPCPTLGSSLPPLSALPLPHSQGCCLGGHLGNRQEAKNQTDFQNIVTQIVIPLSVFTSFWGFWGGGRRVRGP